MIFLLIVTIASMLLAVIMSVVAWRVAGEERRRSEARVATLAAEIHGADLELRPDWQPPSLQAGTEVAGRDGGWELPAAGDTRVMGGLFATAQPAPSGSRLAAVMAVGVVVFGSALTLALFLSSGSSATASKRNATVANRANEETRAKSANLANHENPATLPLELVALGHDRAGNTLTVRGVVRNPDTGAAVDRLTAIVLVFNRDGGFLGSGRAVVESTALGPGGESTFVVTVPDTGDVGRYRVSFRTDDRVVPHVDRREQTLAKS